MVHPLTLDSYFSFSLEVLEVFETPSVTSQRQVFYDDQNVWHFCAREEDRSCADQYSLPTTLRSRMDQQPSHPQNISRYSFLGYDWIMGL